MAFQDSIEITFFPKVWEKIKDKVQNEGIYAFKGKVDGSHDTPAFLVESLEDPAELEKKSISRLHIQINGGFDSAKEITQMKETLT